VAPRKARELGPDGLGNRGKTLWTALKTGAADHDALVLEICRTADRLDRLEVILSGAGNEWITFKEKQNGDVIVVIDSALTEARQQALAMRALMADIKKVPVEKPEQGGGVVDELKKRRATRHGSA
jgi:hypothetical protein